MDNNDIRRMDPILPYSRRYVVVGDEERDILDTKYVNINDYYILSDGQKTYLAEKLVLTRYPSRLAAREAELALNGLVLEESHGS